jgi:hypothetical protein
MKSTDFKKYIKKVKQQLDCNATKDFKKKYITYLYSNEQVDQNLYYFKKCMTLKTSPYKALLFFYDFLNGENF